MTIRNSVFLFCLLATQITQAQTPWTNRTSSLTWMKSQPKFEFSDYRLKEYVRHKDKDWDKIKDNEFELHRRKQAAADAITKQIEKFRLDDEFMLRTSVTLWKYDFENVAFLISEGKGHHDWHGPRDERWSSAFKSRDLYFSNWELLKALPMSSAEAEALLDARRDGNGKTDHRVYLNIGFEDVAARHGFVRARITSLTFYADAERTKVLHELQLPKRKRSLLNEAEALLKEASR